MKGDFTRFTHDPGKHYTRVLRQQGRVDVDADWNEFAEIFTHLERTEAIDVIGRCGVPEHGGGYKIDHDGENLTVSPGRLYVDGILCALESEAPVSIEEQPDLLGYRLPEEDGVYLVYADVWERHVTFIEDPEIREVALGGPDTATRTRTLCQVRLHRLGDGEIEDFECQPFPATPNTSRLAARTEPADEPSNPCVVPAGAGYRGLENRLYRVEIHDDGRGGSGSPGTPTFKWSRDNGSVVLPIASIDAADRLTVQRLGYDEVLTVKDQGWVEISGDETDLSGQAGTLARVQEIDPDDLEIAFAEMQGNLTDHAADGHLKLRRWDHAGTDDVALVSGAVPIQADWYELEDGVQVRFDTGAHYDVGDYWVIPARTREGDVLWPQDGDEPAALAPRGVHHHYCALALVRRDGGVWGPPRDCRPTFSPLTEIDGGSCCLRVEPGDDLQQAIDTVVGEGGGSICLCRGIHVVQGPVRLRGARNVRIGGEGTATVLRLRTDEGGAGGIVIESSERVTIETMVIASDEVTALIAVRHDEDAALSRSLVFRGLTMLNRTASDGQTSISCGFRLAHTTGVAIDECRIAAEAGVLGLWGNSLPDLSEPSEGEGGPGFVEVTFDDLTVGDVLHVNDAFTDTAVTVTGENFYVSSGGRVQDGFARVADKGRAGGLGKDLQLSNINLRFGIAEAYDHVRVAFADFGGNTNLRVNGESESAFALAKFDGKTLGGVRVSVTQSPGSSLGVLQLDASTARIEEFAIGGQELWIDNVVFSSAADEPPAPGLSYGNGVTALRMKRSQIRYEEFGVFSCRSERWTIDGCDLRPLDADVWDALTELLPTPEEDGLPPYAAALSALETLFADVDATGGGVALAAVLWRDSVVRGSDLVGGHGVLTGCWIGGAAVGNRVSTTEAGLFAAWLHGADWRDNRVSCSGGVAMGFTGCYRVRIEGNRLRGTVGLTNVSFGTALGTLAIFTGGVTRSYGDTGDDATLTALWIFTEETIALTGLDGLFDVLQDRVEADGLTSMPVSVVLAARLRDLLSKRSGADGTMSPVIHLRVTGNDVAADRQCVALDDILALGSLVLQGNRLHTITGQAVRLLAHGLAANAHLVVFVCRALLALLRNAIDDALRDAEEQNDPELITLLTVLAGLLEQWQSGSEAFFELDFRVEGNTVRSRLTAIEFNLFELAVLDNHVTLQERPVRGGRVEATAVIFGTVTDQRGETVAGAAVRITGGNVDRSTETGSDGKFRIDGLPAGTFTATASESRYFPSRVTVKLEDGERVEQDFALKLLQFGTGIVARAREYPFANAEIARQRRARAGPNPEIAEIIAALEASPALEPLAEAMRDGAHTDARVYASYLRDENGPLSNVEARRAAADAVVAVGGLTSDAETDQLSEALGDALRANNGAELERLLPRFVAALQDLVDSRGILARGIGCRIVGNQVLVPVDARPETEAIGGIEVSVSYLELSIAIVLGRLLLQAFGASDKDFGQLADPLLGVTDTLVDNNEVSGGVGHGVSIQGVAGLPDSLLDLCIRGNQVRGTAGTGIFLNGHAYVVGAEITGNHVVECGRSAGFSRSKGGIIVHTAAVCRLHGNHAERCGAGQTGVEAFGIDVDTVYDAQITNNQVLANGADQGSTDSGGVQLVETYGAVGMHDNVIAFNRGRGLSWINSARQQDAALLPNFLMVLANAYLRVAKSRDALADEEQAAVQNNVLKAEDPGVPLFNLLNLTELSFNGNTCRSTSTAVPLGEIQGIGRGVITNNLLNSASEQTLSIKKMSTGVVLGNVGNKGIEVKSLGAEVERGLNVPAV